MADDTRIDVQFGAQTQDLESGTKRAASAVDDAGKKMGTSAAEAKKLDDALTKLMASVDKNYKNTLLLSQGVDLLDRNLAAGNISGEQHAQMLNKLETAFGNAAEGANKATESMHLNGAATRELMVLAHEASQGQFNRLGGSLMVLANRMGGLSASTMGLVAALGAVALPIVVIAERAHAASTALREMQNGFLATGNAAAFSEQQQRGYLGTLVNSFGYGVAEAGKIEAAFTRIPGVTQKVQDALTNLVPGIHDVFGGDVEKIAASLAAAFAGGGQALLSWGEPIRLFNTQQRIALEDAAKTFDIQKAQDIALQALEQRFGAVASRAKIVGEFWADAKRQMADQGPVTAPMPGDAKDRTSGPAETDEMRRRGEVVREYSADTRELNALLEKRGIAEKAVAEATSDGERALAQAALNRINAEIDMHKDKGAASRMEEWRAELAQRVEMAGESRKEQLQTEISFWEEVKAGTRLTGQEETQIRTQLSRARLQLGREETRDYLDGLKTQLEEDRNTGMKRVELARQYAKEAASLTGADSPQAQQAAREALRIEREYNNEQRAERLRMVDEARANDLEEVDALREKARSMQAIDRDNIAEITQLKRQALAEELRINLEALTLKQQEYKLDTKEYEQYEAEKAKIRRKYQQEAGKLDTDYVNEQAKVFERGLQPVSRAVGSTLQQMLTTQMSAKDAMKRIAASIISDEIAQGVQRIGHWAAVELAKTAATAAGEETRLGVKGAAAAQGAAMESASGAKSILKDAYKAAAGVYASVSDIPYVGWILAPAAAAGAFATVAAFGASVGSAQGGWDLPSFSGGMPAVLHEREMVLPKEHADTIRNLGKNGGSGAAHGPVIIQALDARSFADFAKRNPAGFATAVGHARRMGHLRQ